MHAVNGRPHEPSRNGKAHPPARPLPAEPAPPVAPGSEALALPGRGRGGRRAAARDERLRRWERHRLREHRFIRACFGLPTDCTPVWYLRQAGSYLPEHRALVERWGLLTVARTPELCARASLLPVQRLGVDAAVMFADIMLPLAGMGVRCRYEADGLVVENPVRGPEDLGRLGLADPEESAGFVLEAERMVREELGRTPVIGFAGGPFTVAAYLIEGGPTRHFTRTKAFMRAHPEAWRRLLDLVAENTIRYLRAQADAGVDALMLYDAAVGVLSPRDYREFVWPFTRRILAGVADTGLPRLHFGTEAANLVDAIAEAGADVVAVDWRVSLREARRRLGAGRAVQGNLDPTALLVSDFATVAEEARRVLEEVEGGPGHIFSLGHHVDPATPADHLARLAELVHERTRA